MGWTSDSEEGDNYEWDSEEGEKEPTLSSFGPGRSVSGREWEAGASSSREASESGPSSLNLKSCFRAMGFSEDMVVKALKENREGDMEGVLEALLAYEAIENSPSRYESLHANCSSVNEGDNLFDLDDFEYEEMLPDDLSKDRKISTLVNMGFPAEEASSAIDRCGPDAEVLELADSICAAQIAAQFAEGQSSAEPNSAENVNYVHSFTNEQKRRRVKEERKIKRSRVNIHRDLNHAKKECIKKVVMHNEDGAPSQFMSIPKPMIGFGLPSEPARVTKRSLSDAAIGPPYFYYENVALAPPGVWDTISRFLYDIEPEFVDSKFFCAAARKRGYVHNLPINNRFPLQPIPQKTIQAALPQTRNWWPAWDERTQFNCLQTCISAAKLLERIRLALTEFGDPPPQKIQKWILLECRKWNLVWVGRNKVAPLETYEYEMLLGFPRDHTRGVMSRTDRFKSLGNSFQVDTVAYHLSVLKNIFPDGITVLSLFSGIGGAEVALHRLGIRLKVVVSVELSEANRNVVRSWWEQTNQTGTLIDFGDIQEIDGEKLKQLISKYGGFDLVIGGSPCNNLAGSNRYHRDGLEGTHSSLFYDYVRVLDLVKNIMGRN